MTTTSTPNITEKQEQAIRALCSKAGVNVPEHVTSFTRVQASQMLDHLADLVDGPQRRPRYQRNRSSDQTTVGDRCRIGLAAKMVHALWVRAGRDPMVEDPAKFKQEVLRLYRVLAELEEEAPSGRRS